MQEFYAHGKLLLSSEYLILDGAKGLALPTKKGQKLIVDASEDHLLHWESYNHDNELWFSMSCTLDFNNIESTDQETAEHLINLLSEAKKINPNFLNEPFTVQTFLEFPNNWGLGSSSTLISTIAQWAKVNPYQLLKGRFKGSGYDIACATASSAITYRIVDQKPSSKELEFNPDFKDDLYFVYLGQKQISSEQINSYNRLRFNKDVAIAQIDHITDQMIKATSSEAFQKLMKEHEELLASILKIQPIQEQLFEDYPGAVKSLGAWGGDFALLCGSKKTPSYVIEKGFNTVIPFRDMILS